MDTKEKKYTLVHIEPSDENILKITDFIKTKFNFTVKSNLYIPNDISLVVYDTYKKFIMDKTDKLQKPIITLSPDPAISGATISGVSEKYMFSETKDTNVTFNTDVKIIYIDQLPNLTKKEYKYYSDFNDAIISDCLSLNQTSYTQSRVSINPANICFIGLNEEIISDEQQYTLNELNFDYYSLQTLRKKGIKKIIDNIVADYKHDNVHIVIDLSCLATQYAPSAIRTENNNNGFDIDELKLIINCIKELENINSIDITGYNFGLTENKTKHNTANNITVHSIEVILSSLINDYKKTLNIIDENSKFLIWKKLNDEEPVGWLILRNMSNKDKQEIINAIGDDNIINIPITEDDEIYEALVTTTTIKEQQERSFYTSNNVTDCCLYPGEKINMLFELLNNS